MISRTASDSQIPPSVAEAYDGVQSLVAHDCTTSLEELQGAVEYLLTKVMEARGLNGASSRFN